MRPKVYVWIVSARDKERCNVNQYDAMMPQQFLVPNGAQWCPMVPRKAEKNLGTVTRGVTALHFAVQNGSLAFQWFQCRFCASQSWFAWTKAFQFLVLDAQIGWRALLQCFGQTNDTLTIH